MSKVAISVLCIAIGYLSLLGPTGWSDRSHFVIAPLGVIAAALVWRRSLGIVRLHLVWLLVTAVVAQQLYRLYDYERFAAQSYREQMLNLERSLDAARKQK